MIQELKVGQTVKFLLDMSDPNAIPCHAEAGERFEVLDAKDNSVTLSRLGSGDEPSDLFHLLGKKHDLTGWVTIVSSARSKITELREKAEELLAQARKLEEEEG